MYSRVDLGSWISCVHQFKLRAHFTSIHQDLIHSLALLVCWCRVECNFLCHWFKFVQLKKALLWLVVQCDCPTLLWYQFLEKLQWNLLEILTTDKLLLRYRTTV